MIELKNAAGSAKCEYKSLDGRVLLSCCDSYPMISASLKEGITYGVISDFSEGSWGLVKNISEEGELWNGTIELNGKTADNSALRMISCSVGSIPEKCPARTTIRSYINKSIKKKETDMTFEDLKEKFYISDGRLDRRINLIGVEIWRFSLLAGFLQKKKIFSFPWLSPHHVFWGTKYSAPILDFLKSQGKIILIPTNRIDIAQTLCDEFIDIRYETLFPN